MANCNLRTTNQIILEAITLEQHPMIDYTDDLPFKFRSSNNHTEKIGPELLEYHLNHRTFASVSGSFVTKQLSQNKCKSRHCCLRTITTLLHKSRAKLFGAKYLLCWELDSNRDCEDELLPIVTANQTTHIYSLDLLVRPRSERKNEPKTCSSQMVVVKHGDESPGIESGKNPPKKSPSRSNCKSIGSANYFCDIKAGGHS